MRPQEGRGQVRLLVLTLGAGGRSEGALDGTKFTEVSKAFTEIWGGTGLQGTESHGLEFSSWWKNRK